MDNSLLGSIAFKKFLATIGIGFLLGLFSYLLGYLPQDDLLQGIWIFLTTSFSAFLVFRKQINKFEKKEERWKNLAEDLLTIRVTEEPHLIATLLLGKDAPEIWVKWINEMYHIDLFNCRCIHAIDSLFYANDLPGQGITRATKWLAEVLYGLDKASETEKEEAISIALEKLVKEYQPQLGDEFHPGFYYKRIEEGPLPYGVFIESQVDGAYALATTYKKKILNKEDEIEEIGCARLGLNLKDMTQEQWEALVDQIDELFPWFNRQNLGSGPRSLTSKLFVQESHPVDQEKFETCVKKLPALLGKYLPPPPAEETQEEEKPVEN